MRAMTIRLVPIAVASVSVLTVPARASADTASCVASAEAGYKRARDVSTLTQARDKLRACAAVECPEEVRSQCVAWLKHVEEQIPSVVFVAEEDGRPIDDVSVQSRGVLLVSRLDAKPVDLDEGVYTFVFERPNGAKVEVPIHLRVTSKRVEVRARFTKPVTLEPPKPAAAPPVRAPLAPPAPPTAASPLRWVGLAAVGLGAIGLGVGGYFGVRAAGKQSDANCPNNLCGPGSDPAALRDAKSAGDTATVFFVAGGLLAAAGITLYLVAPKGSERPTAVRLDTDVTARGAAAVLRGTF